MWKKREREDSPPKKHRHRRRDVGDARHQIQSTAVSIPKAHMDRESGHAAASISEIEPRSTFHTRRLEEAEEGDKDRYAN